MNITSYLYNEAKPIWDGYFTHPFIDELGKGTLDKAKFERYLIQDYLYLREYAKAFAMGIIKAQTMDDQRFFHEAITGCIEGETAVHIQYLKDFGHEISALELAKFEMNAISYTSYVNGVAMNFGIKEILAATLPCMWSYYEIGCYVRDNYKEYYEDNFYKGWIDSYSADGYKDLIKVWIDYVEKKCEGISEQEKEQLSEIFNKASLYEKGFWDMAYQEVK